VREAPGGWPGGNDRQKSDPASPSRAARLGWDGDVSDRFSANERAIFVIPVFGGSERKLLSAHLADAIFLCSSVTDEGGK
jgi:hypothetical protein